MMRAYLAVTAGLLCALMGMRKARRLQGDCARLARWEALLRRLALILRQGALPLPEALRCAACEALAPDDLLRSLASALEEHPLDPLSQLPPMAGAEAEVIGRLAPLMVSGTLESRVLALEQAGAEIAVLGASAREQAARDAHMWHTLGWTGGACLTLMLL